MSFDPLYSEKASGYFENHRTELLKFLPDGISSALDIGCGSGNFGELLKAKKGYEVWGVEPEEKSASDAVKKIDRLIKGQFSTTDTAFKNKKFDLICFNDVLEHLSNPSDILKDCRVILNSNGYVLASIPNMRYFPVLISLIRDRDFKYQKHGVMDETHLRFFTRKSMIRLFEESGYEVLTIEGINGYIGGRFKLLKSIFFKFQDDMQYPQFALLCKAKS